MVTERMTTFEIARDLDEAKRVVVQWRRDGFSEQDLSLLCTYRAAKELGDAIIDAAEHAQEGIPHEIDHELASILDAPAVLLIEGFGPVVTAGSVLSAADRGREGQERIASGLLRAGVPGNRLKRIIAEIGEGRVFVSCVCVDGDGGWSDTVGVAFESGFEIQHQDRRSTGDSSSHGHHSDEDEPPFSELNPRYAGEVADRDVFVVDASLPLGEAMQRLRENTLPFLMVVAAGRVAGLLTAEDIPARRRPSNQGLPQPTAGDAMIEDFLHCFEDETAAEVAALMERLQVTQLPVLDRERRLRGIIRSPLDLLAGADETQISD